MKISDNRSMNILLSIRCEKHFYLILKNFRVQITYMEFRNHLNEAKPKSYTSRRIP